MTNTAQSLFYTLHSVLKDKTPDTCVIHGMGAATPPPALTPQNTAIVQYFKPYADGFIAQGFTVYDSPDLLKEKPDLILLSLPKQQTETQYLIATYISVLCETGMLICSADNKSGGSRLKKTLEVLGLEPEQIISKNKCKTAVMRRPQSLSPAIEQALQDGAEQSVLDQRYMSQPGIYGWNKVDKGSEILAQFIPDDLKGHGADFGCGYGYLSIETLRKNPKLKHWSALDADSRAIKTCVQNLFSFDLPKEMHWQDLRQASKTKQFDVIVMNPPFHEGKASDQDIGRDFIKNAATALKPRGALYMVANNQLNYEQTLEQHFYRTEKLYEGQGFKVYKAQK